MKLGMTQQEIQHVMRHLEHEMLNRPKTFRENITLGELYIEIAHTAIHEAQALTWKEEEK